MTQTKSEFTLQYSSVRQVKKNTSYPFTATIHSCEDLAKVAAFDHIGGRYKDGVNNRGRLVKGYRSKKTFDGTTVDVMDVDNTNPDPLGPDLSPEQWVTPADVRKAFPDSPFYIVYSRNNMKEKDGKAPRPKFHVYFIVNDGCSGPEVAKRRKALREYFPAFDPAALDFAHFIYGVEKPQVEFYDGEITVDEFLRQQNTLPEVIAIGTRNATLSKYAAKVLKRYGDTEQARRAFEEAAQRCEQLLDDSELETIYGSAQGFFHNTIEKAPGYMPPDEYAAQDFAEEGEKKKPITSKDVKAILQELGIVVRLNLITGMVEITGMPAELSKENAANTLPVLLQDYMTTHGLKGSRQLLDDCLVLIEDENRFNPVWDMLNSTKYDGVDHLQELFEILGIQDNDRECTYVRKWLHQCVALDLNNGAEPFGADGVLALQGPQGTGKTLICRKLAVRSDWFAEGVSIDLDKKDSIIQSTGCWIAELGELDSTLKREQSALKAFLTSSTDTYRQPYARERVTKPRRTSFCATVNPQEFLNDETGSRRFWVVHVDHINIERVKAITPEWTRQLWRQVYEQYYLQDEQGFRLTDAERAELQECNKDYEKLLPGEQEIIDNLNFEAPMNLWRWVKVSVLRDSLNIRTASPQQVGRVLAKLAQRDSRIQVKAPHNVKQYLMPPRATNEFLAYDDDDKPLLSDPQPLTAAYAAAYRAKQATG